MNPEQGTELRSGKIISSSLETPVPTDPDMAQSSANDSDSNETSDISSQLSEIRESYERKINELQSEFSQLKDLMIAVISKTDGENRPSSSKGPSKPAHTPGSDSYLVQNMHLTHRCVGIFRTVVGSTDLRDQNNTSSQYYGVWISSSVWYLLVLGFLCANYKTLNDIQRLSVSKYGKRCSNDYISYGRLQLSVISC